MSTRPLCWRIECGLLLRTEDVEGIERSELEDGDFGLILLLADVVVGIDLSEAEDDEMGVSVLRSGSPKV